MIDLAQAFSADLREGSIELIANSPVTQPIPAELFARMRDELQARLDERKRRAQLVSNLANGIKAGHQQNA